jgi:Ca-activated chloride channel family protein
MRFAYPYLLLLLSLVPLVGILWVWLFRRARAGLSRLIAPALQAKLMPAQSQGRFMVQFVLVMLGLTTLIFAAARPQWGMKDEKVFTRGRNLVIALDVSRSMLAQDVHPNRLGRAKADLMDLIDELKGDRAALLAFRNKGSLLCPLTTDYSFLRQALDGTGPESAPRGETDLGDAIRKSLEALDPAVDEFNAILLISDGEDLKGGALEAAREAATRNIPIFTVGIGDIAGATIPDEAKKGSLQFRGSPVTTKLMDETLAAVAKASNGFYIPLRTAGTAHTTLGSIYRNHLARIATQQQQETMQNRIQDRYQWFLFPALLALLIAAWFSRGRLSGAIRRAQPLASAALLVFVVSFAQAQSTNLLTPTMGQGSTNEPPPMVVAPGREGARIAQGWLKQGKYREAAEGFLSAARGADRDEADRYRYNAAYSYYQAKNNDKCLETLRPLLSSKKFVARAGELQAKLQMEQVKVKGAEDPLAKYEALKEAAVGFQLALRETPKDERCNQNFSRAAWPIPEARESAHIAKVLKEHEKTSPDQLLGTMLKEQRKLMDESCSLFTNEAPEMVRLADALGARQEKQSDLWIPLKQHVIQAVTNQQQQAQVLQQVELTRDMMKGASEALSDLLPESVGEVAQSEPSIYQLWKAVAAPPNLVDEDIVCQSNAIKKLAPRYLQERDTQPEALQVTKLFSQRFPEWAKQYVEQAKSNTNMPPFKAEDQAKIRVLATHTEKLQEEILAPKTAAIDRPGLKKQALKNLLEIRELLPKNPSSSQNQQQQDQQQEQQQKEQKQQQDQQQQEQKQQDQQQQQEQQQEQQEKKKDEAPKDVQELLRRALEREKERENEKRERMSRLPMSPSERDW